MVSSFVRLPQKQPKPQPKPKPRGLQEATRYDGDIDMEPTGKNPPPPKASRTRKRTDLILDLLKEDDGPLSAKSFQSGLRNKISLVTDYNEMNVDILLRSVIGECVAELPAGEWDRFIKTPVEEIYERIDGAVEAKLKDRIFMSRPTSSPTNWVR